jgi:methyl-accepting chemotaxis protein
VRALAQRSAQAAKEIKNLISASTAEVDDGVSLVMETGKTLERIMAQVIDISRVVSTIANGATAQATTLQEISSSVQSMDQDTQKNAAMVEETTTASHNLRQEAENLLISVRKFKVAKSERTANKARRPQGREARDHVADHVRGNTARKLNPVAAPEAEDWEQF